jgi:hypothetical protein
MPVTPNTCLLMQLAVVALAAQIRELSVLQGLLHEWKHFRPLTQGRPAEKASINAPANQGQTVP